MTDKEENRQNFVRGYSAGWNQCLEFVKTLANVSGETLERITTAMEITERSFIPRPYKDAERRMGKDEYSKESSKGGTD